MNLYQQTTADITTNANVIKEVVIAQDEFMNLEYNAPRPTDLADAIEAKKHLE